MSDRAARVIYAGTTDGLYRITEEGGEWEARLAGFEGLGTMRAAVVQDADDPRRLYAGTTKTGFAISTNGGDTWAEANQGVRYKDIWSIAQHPSTKTMWLGTSPADVFRSDDRGETWQECASLQMLPTTRGWTGPIPPHVSRMKSIALDPHDPAAIYGAIEEGWAVRSHDGGQTWEQLAENMDHDAHYVTVLPDGSNVVIVTGGKGVYRSADRGSSWSKCDAGLEAYRYTPAYVVVHPSRPQSLLTTVTMTGPGGWTKPDGPGLAFARSDDQGQTWRILPDAVAPDFRPVPRGLVGDAHDPDLCFAGMTDGSVWRSTDGGAHFEPLVHGLPSVASLAVTYR